MLQVPYLKRVAIAHKLHHSEKFDGVPWGLFLGPMVRDSPSAARPMHFPAPQAALHACVVAT